MTNAGLFLYPWSFAEEGCERLIEYARGLGIGRLYVASAYHAGFLVHPYSSECKIRLLEDGVIYFRPDQRSWSGCRIQPTVSALCESTNVFGDICVAAERAAVELCAWTVCLHNTRIGLQYPECTVQNVYGDSYPHALTPGHPDARAYVASLINDLTTNYPIHSVFLEAPNYRGRAHGSSWVSGHHHERAGVHFRELEESLLSISFNPADVEAAERAGVEVSSVREAVRAHLDRYFDAAPEIPDELPRTLAEFRGQVPALADYERYFRRTEESLLQELRQIAQPRGVRLVGGASPSVDVVLLSAFGASLQQIAQLTRSAREKLTPGQELVVSIRLGFAGPGMGTAVLSEADLGASVETARANGADAVAFYNYAEAPRRSVEWIRGVLENRS